jgi:chaperonin GroES
MKIRPQNSYVLVTKAEKEKETSSGIILSHKEETRQDIGKVIATGPNVDMEVKEGMMVVFNKYAPEFLEIEGDEYLAIDQEDIIAVVEG